MTAPGFLLPAPFAPLSPSVAETFQLCPRKELYNHYLVENEFNELLHKGQAVHNTVRDACRRSQRDGEWPGMDELLPMLRAHLSQLPPSERGQEQEGSLEERVDRWQTELLETIGGFLLFAQKTLPPGSVIASEEWVRVDLRDPAGTVRVTGRLDLLVRVNGELWVIDVKTGKAPERLEVGGPLALALYTAATRQAYPGEVVRAYELYPASGLLLEYGGENTGADLTRLAALGHRHFVETEWPPHRGDHCQWCDHYRRCHGLDEPEPL